MTASPKAEAILEGEGYDPSSSARRADRRDRWLTFAAFATILLAWTAATGSGLWQPFIKPIFLPSPVTVIETFFRLAEQGYQGRSLLHHVTVSFTRFAIAFSCCVVIGVPLGLMIGMNRQLRAIFEPPIQAIRPIPKLALLPLFMIWFGIGNLSKVIVIAAPVLPLIAISAMQAVRSISQKKIQAAQALGASPWTVFWRVVLPASLPGIFTGVRVAISIGVTMLVGAELTATSDGVAWMALTAAEYLSTDIVLVGVLIMAGMGYGLDRLVRAIDIRVVHWSGKE